MDDEQALLAAIRAFPDEDTPRLAYADWLDESDRPERAEFIRLQIEFDQLLRDGSDSQAVYDFLVSRDYVTRPAAKWEHIDAGIARRVALASRLKEIATKNERQWLEELPGGCGVAWTGFTRGLPAVARVTDFGELAASAAVVMAAAPQVELVCHGLTAEDAQRLADAGLIPWVHRLTVHGECADGLRELGRHPATLGVRELLIDGSDGADGARLAEALAGSPHWGGLRSLHATRVWFAPVPAQVLFQAPHLRGLIALGISGTGWESETVRVFAEAAFPNLRDLRFTHCGLDDEAAEVLANVPSLASVRYLDLASNQVAGRGATALLCSPNLTGMAFIGLEGNPVRGLDRKALSGAPAGGLRLLHCHGCRLTVRDVGAVVRSPRLRDLWYLDLDDNNLATGAVREIVQGFRDRCPPVIWLTMNRIGDEGAVALANWPAAERLRMLELSTNPLTTFGVSALLDSPHLRNLDGLGVPRVASKKVEATLAERFKEHGRMA